jgi:hypothetical protein
LKRDDDDAARGHARNHYAHLRSALGELVARTILVDGCSLVLEGGSDQGMIAGMSGIL